MGGHDPSRIVDDLIQATASGKPAAGGKIRKLPAGICQP
jgi:hypothetical protein